jgi:hypothetical protein
MIQIIAVQTLVQGLKQLNPSSHSNNLKKYTDHCSNCGPNGLIGCPYTWQQLRFNILLRWRKHGTESCPQIVFQQKTSSLSNLNRLPLVQTGKLTRCQLGHKKHSWTDRNSHIKSEFCSIHKSQFINHFAYMWHYIFLETVPK